MSNEAPLANIGDEWTEFTDHQNCNNIEQANSNELSKLNKKCSIKEEEDADDDDDLKSYTESEVTNVESPADQLLCDTLKELVSNFDEQIISCFNDYDKPIDQLAPVQVLNQDELVNECQLWWTLTSRLGQVLPIDWKHTTIRSRFIASLLGTHSKANKAKCKSVSCLHSKSKSNKDLESEEDRLVSQACNYLSYVDSYRNQSNRSRSPDCCSQCNTIESDSDDPTFARDRHAIEEDEQLAKDLDFHCLILCSSQVTAKRIAHARERLDSYAQNSLELESDHVEEHESLPFTAEQVLNEIDALMNEDVLPAEHEQLADQFNALELSSISMQSSLKGDSDCITLDSGLPESNPMTDSLLLPSNDQMTGVSASASSVSLSSDLIFNRLSSNADNSTNEANSAENNRLNSLTICQLNELYLDLERAIQQLSEVLIQQLALRDELEYEKEQKNSFISLLLTIQGKRRKQNLQRKGTGKTIEGGKYLSTVIPYPNNAGPPDLQTLQVLIKILKAINDDSPAVPNLLTDFILKVLCAH